MQKEDDEVKRLTKENQELKDMIVHKMLLPKYQRTLISQTERAFALLPENVKAALMTQTLEMLYKALTQKLSTGLAPTMIKQAEMDIRKNYRGWMESELKTFLSALKEGEGDN